MEPLRIHVDLARLDVTPDPRPVKRAKDAKPLWAKPKPAAPVSVRVERATWYVAVRAKYLSTIWTADDYAVIADGGRPVVHCHHIVSQQELRKHGLSPWADPRNGVPVSERRHARSHSRLEPIRRDELPDEAFAFIADHPALRPYFDRVYKEEGAE